MRILRIVSSANPVGGGVIEAINQFAIEMEKLGHSTEILSLDSPDSNWLLSSTVKVNAIGPAMLNYAYCPKLINWLTVHHTDYDFFIIDGLWQYHSFGTWLALKKNNIPYFVFTHGMLDPWFKKTYPLKHLKKWLYWIIVEYWVLRDAKAVLFTCEEEKVLARQSFWLYCCNESVASLGIAKPMGDSAQQKALFLENYPHLINKRIILFLSRIHEKKGCDLLLEAFGQVAKTHEHLHLLMAGPDQTDWTSKLKMQADSLGISNAITWAGMLTGDMKWGAFYTAEIFCLPSHQENFGFVVAEALACGKPVLISNKVNIWREIAADNAGFINKDTVSGTINNLEKWLALNSTDYELMCERAVSCFKNRFHVRQAAERLLEIITQTKDNK